MRHPSAAAIERTLLLASASYHDDDDHPIARLLICLSVCLLVSYTFSVVYASTIITAILQQLLHLISRPIILLVTYVVVCNIIIMAFRWLLLSLTSVATLTSIHGTLNSYTETDVLNFINGDGRRNVSAACSTSLNAMEGYLKNKSQLNE